MDESTLKTLAEYFVLRQPSSVRRRLQQDTEFVNYFGLQSEPVIGIGAETSIYSEVLFSAARQRFAKGTRVQLSSIEGQPVSLEVERQRVTLRIGRGEKERQVPFDELTLLSEDNAARTRVFGDTLKKMGPMRSDFSILQGAAETRPLTDSELGALLDELFNGVAKVQRGLASKLQSRTLTLSDLVPESLVYFERFCGPDPAGEEPESYLRFTLPAYRKALLERDLEKGLEVSLLGALRDDLAPMPFLESISDDSLWEALTACEPERDPFSLLAALDVALSRQHDPRFGSFADTAVGRLATGELRVTEGGVDAYDLLTLLCNFVLCRINVLEGAMSRPPFWRRMCAWMQATLLLRIMHELEPDLEKLHESIIARLPIAGQFANLVDLRREPMVRALAQSSPMLKGEVQGRLQQLKVRHEASGRAVPREKEIEEGRARIDSQEVFAWAFPGPLEGHRSKEEAVLPQLKEGIASLPSEVLIARVAKLAQIFSLDEELIELSRRAVDDVGANVSSRSVEERLSSLLNASTVSAGARQPKLARAISEALQALASELADPESVASALQVLIVAAAAFELEDSWAEWLDDQLVKLALRLPPGQPSRVFCSQLQHLRKVTKVELAVCSRAEAISSAATF